MPGVGTTHHLKLGNEFLLIRPESYSKRPAPTFGARITSGDPDFNNLSIWQHWVQHCWVGGMGAEEWVDDAMYDTGIGADTTNHEKAMLSRLLSRPTGANQTLGGRTGVLGYRFCVYNNILYVLVCLDGTADSRLYSYSPTTQAWTSVSMPGSLFIARCISTFDGKLFVGGLAGSTPKLYYATSPGSWTTVVNPAGVGSNAVRALRQYNGKLYVAYGVYVWRMKDDQTWDGNTVFYKVNANSGSNYVSTFEVHRGYLYMLSQNGHLHRTDGNNTFDMWSWDGNTYGVSLRSYDGKLFVGTYEFTNTADIGYGVLYQWTDTAVTELKRWGKDGKATSIGQMIVWGRKLYYGASSLLGAASGFGIAVYDSVEDGHSIWATQQDSTTYPDASGTGIDWMVDDVIQFGSYMFCAVRGYGIFVTTNSFGDMLAGVAPHSTHTASTNGGTIISSLYDAGTPGLDKLWRKITVFCDLTAATSFVLSYSTDGGTSYTSLGTTTGPSTNGQYVFYLNNIQATKFKWKIVLKTSNSAQTPVLRSVVVAYLPQPEPNWMWSFTIPIADTWTLLDEAVETKSTNALIAYIEGLFRSQQLVTFIDIDGTTWATGGPGVLVYDIMVVHHDVEAPREADIRVTLLESVETY